MKAAATASSGFSRVLFLGAIEHFFLIAVCMPIAVGSLTLVWHAHLLFSGMKLEKSPILPSFVHDRFSLLSNFERVRFNLNQKLVASNKNSSSTKILLRI